MGFFSWKTADTKESIGNISSAKSHTKKHGNVYLLQPYAPAICESGYDGYGFFGGVDAYFWLASKNITEPQFMRLIDEVFNSRIKSDIKAITEQLNYKGMFTMADDERAFLESKKLQYENLLQLDAEDLSELKKALYALLKTGDFSEESYEALQENSEQRVDIDYEFFFDMLRCWGIKMEKDKSLIYPLKFSFNKGALYADYPASEWCEYQGFFY